MQRGLTGQDRLRWRLHWSDPNTCKHLIYRFSIFADATQVFVPPKQDVAYRFLSR